MERYSKQKAEILEVLKLLYTHPTAEEIYNILKENKSTSSRGTVYRNLKKLEEKNIIRKISIPDAPDRYDYIRENHIHIVCNKCKKVIDFKFDFDGVSLKNKIRNEKQINVDLNSTIIFGICEQCNK